MRILLVDTERGSSPVAHLKGPDFHIVKAPSFEDADKAYNYAQKEGPFDLIVVDTVTRLADWLRQDLTVSPETIKAKGIWGARSNFQADSRSDYRMMQDMVARLFRNLVDLPCRAVIATFHEGEAIEPGTGLIKCGPKTNQKLLETLIAASDAMIHLGMIPEVVEGFPIGTRRLRFKPNKEYMCKARRPEGGEEPPAVILKAELFVDDIVDAVVGPVERNKGIILFGAPGVGKTTLVCTQKGGSTNG